jgi:hypothetical protein
MVSWFGPQNQAGFDLSVAPQNRRREVTAWKQVGLGFPILASRLVEAQRWVVHVASSRRLRRVEAEDGRIDAMDCVGLFYPKITILYVLGPRGNLVFSLLLGPINRTLEGWDSLPLHHLSYAIPR